ncbi:Protein of unknown function [Pyronema omphalodes CBS 100304]|uniref:Uncharacterized protein n=1 Tax=Pyronema omphalodes (strain CBS 100304) TaxID=1076935 RepID=U4LI73_PYROM|nr:Protein of unknown function [Pyronema omphalodes CBS 100304]
MGYPFLQFRVQPSLLIFTQAATPKIYFIPRFRRLLSSICYCSPLLRGDNEHLASGIPIARNRRKTQHTTTQQAWITNGIYNMSLYKSQPTTSEPRHQASKLAVSGGAILGIRI